MDGDFVRAGGEWLSGDVEGEGGVDGELDGCLGGDFAGGAGFSARWDEGDVRRVDRCSVQVESVEGDDGARGEDVLEVEGEALAVGSE